MLTPDIVMDRDRRLTGMLRGQTDSALAPAGFELNNPWRVRKSTPCIRKRQANILIAREAHLLSVVFQGENTEFHSCTYHEYQTSNSLAITLLTSIPLHLGLQGVESNRKWDCALGIVCAFDFV